MNNTQTVQNTITATALDTMECRPTINELDAEPTAVKLASRKSPGSDGIPPYLVKQRKSSLLLPLRQCWKERSVPQDIRGAKTIILYKNTEEKCEYVFYVHG